MHVHSWVVLIQRLKEKWEMCHISLFWPTWPLCYLWFIYLLYWCKWDLKKKNVVVSVHHYISLPNCDDCKMWKRTISTLIWWSWVPYLYSLIWLVICVPHVEPGVINDFIGYLKWKTTYCSKSAYNFDFSHLHGLKIQDILQRLHTRFWNNQCATGIHNAR